MQLDLADPLLVWLGNADLSVGERPPDAARTTRAWPVAGEQRRGLRQPVTRQDGPAEGFEPFLGFLLEPRSTRDQQPQAGDYAASNRGERQPSQTQPGRPLNQTRRFEQRAPDEPRRRAAGCDACFDRRPQRVVE